MPRREARCQGDGRARKGGISISRQLCFPAGCQAVTTLLGHPATVGCVKKLLLRPPQAGMVSEPPCLQRCLLGSLGRAGAVAAGLETLNKSARQLKVDEVADGTCWRTVGN